MGYVSTPGNQFGSTIPDANEDPNIAADLLNLAKAIEKRVVGIYADVATRNSAVAAMGPIEGQFAYVQANNAFSVWDGAAWQPFPAAAPSITSGTAAPSGGSNGDIYFKV